MIRYTDLAIVIAAALIATISRTHWTTALTITISTTLIWTALTLTRGLLKRRHDTRRQTPTP